MLRCATCRFFDLRIYNAPGEQKSFGHCNRWHAGYAVRINEVAENEAWVEDDEGWGNVVGPNFGCVLHEPLGVEVGKP